MTNASTIVLITGANSGVGYATVQVLVAASEYHVIMAGRSEEKIKRAAEEISSTGVKGTVSTLVLDVTNEDSIAKAVEEVKQKHGRVDVLINNAGIASQDSNLKKQLQDTLLTNSISPVLVTEAFQSLVLSSPNPRILHVTSGLGSMRRAADKSDGAYNEAYTVYRISKAALNMYMIQNHKELGPKGVKVFAVCPGLVKSNLRGTSEQAINAGGRALDAEVSGRLMLDAIEGRRDADVGKVIKNGGIWDW